MISITILGSSGMFATRERAASGYLVEFDDNKIWLDSGGGTWRNLLDVVDYPELDGILLTHRHPDHTIDLYQAFHARQYGQPEPLAPIPLWAPGETIDRVTSFCPELKESFELNVVSESTTLQIGAAIVTFTSMAHPPETLGVRIEHGDSVAAYSADSGLEADFERLAGGAAVFLCEATLQDSDEPWFGHLQASQAGRLAAELETPNLVLTHLPPGRDLGLSLAEAQAHCPGTSLQLAADGLRLEVG